MQALIDKAQAGLIRKRFAGPEDLVAELHAALVEYLEDRELIRFGPFDASPCAEAGLDDLDHDAMARFIDTARRARQFPLAAAAAPEALLEHLNLLHSGRLTNAAMLLFGKAPQRFLISSEVKCAHFHGTRVAKPIPSHQVYKGTVFSSGRSGGGFRAQQDRVPSVPRAVRERRASRHRLPTRSPRRW